ncbi:MAG: flagellar biosynthetic protein FliR [Planctomycetota bacterium]
MINPLALLNVEKFLIFTLVLTRISGLLISSPIFGAKEAPAMVRALVSLALAVLIMPSQWFATLPYPGSLLVYVLIIGGELMIGLILGMGISILLGGIQMAGDMMSRVGGLSLADVFDPTTSTNVPLFSQMLSLLSAALFMIMGGHRILLGGLLDTFSVIPPGGGVAMFLGTGTGSSGPEMLASLVEMFLVLITQSFHVAIRAAAPVVTAVLLATLVLGLISRTLPQLNVMVIGFGMNAMITFGVFFFSLGAALLVFQDQVPPTLQILFQTLRIPLRSP